jgi:hypothetical protein
VTKSIFTVIDFGAKGSGTVDDSVPIQANINAAVAGRGGIAWLPPGLYTLRSRLSIPDQVVFQSASWETPTPTSLPPKCPSS